MRLEDLKPAKGATKKAKRKGRGFATGMGKTSSRGNNGQGQRSGGGVRAGFEGGQMPLFRRLPKKKYFFVVNQINYGTVNVSELNKYEANSVVNFEVLRNDRKIDNHAQALKILGNGELNIALTVEAHAFSASAIQKIEAAGGKVINLMQEEDSKSDSN
ncbi:MAG: 50S ribosomal protein L15 [Candidatus Sericytochromatia bacterium]|nr:50S ribosomal protein L15 [Candidatus Sericytochromatia bacterium]